MAAMLPPGAIGTPPAAAVLSAACLTPSPGSGRQNAKLEAFKQAIEHSKSRRAQDLQERNSMIGQLSDHLSELSLSENDREAVKRNLSVQQDEYLRELRKQVTISDFQLQQVIGAGAFGVVRLCQKRDTGEVFAMKQMSKTEMVNKNHVHHVRAEKDALSMAQDDWVIRLHYTFQDDTFLYMVMDFLPGGDLMTYLMRKDTFTEEETRFYVAELVEAVDYIHTRLNCVHRDVKPDNVVFDTEGHIRLLDFGLCKHNCPEEALELDLPQLPQPECCTTTSTQALGHLPRPQLQSMVGTPDYMGPEVYLEAPYGKECDWWSVGVIMFEMLFGGPPFSDGEHDPLATSLRVRQWRQHFLMPPDQRVSVEARDLIRGLICDPQDRLTAEGIRSHPFFQGLNFQKLRQMDPPIKPVVAGPMDTSNFDDFEGTDALHGIETGSRHQAATDPSLFAFHDFGYRRDLEAKKPSIKVALAEVMAHASEAETKQPSRRKLSAWKQAKPLATLRLLTAVQKICSAEA